MPKGGPREGAGRPKGVGNLLTRDLREKINAFKCITFLQELVDGKLAEATINERKDAAIALLRKILPDCKQTDLKVEEHPAVFVLNNLPRRRSAQPCHEGSGAATTSNPIKEQESRKATGDAGVVNFTDEPCLPRDPKSTLFGVTS